MKVYEVTLTRTMDLKVAAESEDDIHKVLTAAEVDHWMMPPWDVHIYDPLGNAKTPEACEKLLAGSGPEVVIHDGMSLCPEDVPPEVMGRIEELIRRKREKLIMDEYQLKLPGIL